jgi:hypothetical protein
VCKDVGGESGDMMFIPSLNEIHCHQLLARTYKCSDRIRKMAACFVCCKLKSIVFNSVVLLCLILETYAVFILKGEVIGRMLSPHI